MCDFLQSYLQPDQLELLKESCEHARLAQQQEITNRLNAELADDPVDCSGFIIPVVWFHGLAFHYVY